VGEYFYATTESKNVGSSGALTLAMGSIYSLTVPSAAKVTTYSQATYYVNTGGATLTNGRDNGNGTTTYSFRGSSPLWRASLPGKVTKAGWSLGQLGTVLTFDGYEDPHDPTTTMQPDRDGNSLLMNIPGGSNHLRMGVGGTFKLRCFRMWEIINSDWMNKMIEPDFHFKLLEGSDVLALTPHDAINSNWMDIRALKAGTAVIEVSYDAIDVFGSTYKPSGGRFGAVNPERKGIVVVTVGGGGSSTASVQVQRSGATYGTWDAEFDTWFFTGASKEIDVRLSGSGEADITAWNPDVAGSLHAVTDGRLTIWPGNNIVKAERDGAVTYQVIRGGSVRVVTDVTGRELEAGDTVRVLYGGRIPAYPVPKMSGIYNPQGYAKTAEYDDEITLTAEHLAGAPLRVGGAIADSHLGSGAGAHRSADYDNGLEINMTAGANSGSYCVLPNVYLADLEVAPAPDRDALERACAVVEGLDEADYTAESWRHLQEALGAARALLGDEGAGQPALDEATEALIGAVNGLERKPAPPAVVVPAPTVAEVEAAYGAAAGYAQGTVDALPVSLQRDWLVLGLARGGRMGEESKKAYLDDLAAQVVAVEGKLSSTKYTEYARTVLALTALGVDASSFAGYDLTAPLTEYSMVIRQGINGPIFALLALDSGGYKGDGLATLAEGAATGEADGQGLRGRLIAYILSRELSGGGWSMSASTADPDLTAMALQALAPYAGRGNAVLDATLGRALDALSSLQRTDGGFSSMGAPSCESAAQVVVALCALGIPLNDARFVKGGHTIYDALMSYYDAGSGGFRHVAGGSVDAMATGQGTYALVALRRALAGATSLYDMSDVTLVAYPAGGTGQSGGEQPGGEKGGTGQPGSGEQGGAKPGTGGTAAGNGGTVAGGTAAGGTGQPGTAQPDGSALPGEGGGGQSGGSGGESAGQQGDSGAQAGSGGSGPAAAGSAGRSAADHSGSAQAGRDGVPEAAATAQGTAAPTAIEDDPTPLSGLVPDGAQEGAGGIVLTPRVMLGIAALMVALVLTTILLTRTVTLRRVRREGVVQG
jgi:hypothetical protein